MKVKDLKVLLEKFDDELPVISWYHGAKCMPIEVKKVKALHEPHIAPYYHLDFDSDDDPEFIVDALKIG